MDIEKSIAVFESFIPKEIREDINLTDISYNGKHLFVTDNIKGTHKANLNISQQEALSFVRQIANLMEKQFSYTHPFINVSFGRYRLSAAYQSIGIIDDMNTLTFSVRFAQSVSLIDKESNFLNKKIIVILLRILSLRESIVICGAAGSGKTELLKYLINLIPLNDKGIILDNTGELSFDNEKNLIMWRFDDLNATSSLNTLIKNALRNNPTWFIVSETLGEEMSEILNAVMTGHSLITTFHSRDALSAPKRMARLISKHSLNINVKHTLDDINYHIHFYIFLDKKDGENGTERFIESISYCDEKGHFYELVKRNGDSYLYFDWPDFMKLSDDILQIDMKGENNND